MRFGLCKECKQLNTGVLWYQACNSKHFQQNFKNWTSENSDVDKLIQELQFNAKNGYEKLEWIEYDRFENNFRIIYKYLNDSKDITLEFLNEMNLHLKMNNSNDIIKFYRITKDSQTNNFIMFDILTIIIRGFCDIHKEGLTHQDFHNGNLLNDHIGAFHNIRITDLGLCKPANEKSEKYDEKVYEVLSYIAPEVLKRKKYTQKSDIYSFEIIIYEVFNGLPPYYDIAYEELLAVKICQELRPNFHTKVPQLIEDITKKCVDADPLKRPTAEYLYKRFDEWFINIPIYTSKQLNFNNLPEPKNNDDEKDYSESTEPEFSWSTLIE
ncbi:kinase-like domain-containing protein [Glomus cerebriforme]|uniref:Kinase-like domain-containing protein n=1 Tax=Glomus cerebriforme TaxID=658196 RepID=A0A397TII0_9GLOM|nr:kinase-like domain-containing protein [Glomus cerebriforme]